MPRADYWQDLSAPPLEPLKKRGRIYRTGLIAKGTQQAHRFPRYSADTITLPGTWQRTRDAHC